MDVCKSIQFCRQLNRPVLGVIEDMSGFICPHCGKETNIFKNGGGESMAREMDVPFLGRIPLEPTITENRDAERPLAEPTAQASPGRKAFNEIMEKIPKGVTL